VSLDNNLSNDYMGVAYQRHMRILANFLQSQLKSLVPMTLRRGSAGRPEIPQIHADRPGPAQGSNEIS
jgi:hypothetical protein